MARRVTCDQCGADIDDGIKVVYPGVDEDGDEMPYEADFCSWGCLAEWAVSASVDAERPGV
jgi:hypothetical protein